MDKIKSFDDYFSINESFEDIINSKNYRRDVGFTKIIIKNNILSITHGGNMGDSIERSVDPNLEMIGFPTIEELKKKYEVIEEEGSPDYFWSIEFKIK